MNRETTSQEEISSQFLSTDRGKTKSNAIAAPSIALPKGGGAIKGIDEKFSVNAVNGTSSFSIPFPVSDARGFSPSLGLNYSSGSGNGIFGLGWSCEIPSIKRKTDNKLPRYEDELNSDTFLLSGAEDLVPEFRKNNLGDFIKNNQGNYVVNEFDRTWFGKQFTIKRYRPRIEGLFSMIERWSEKNTHSVHWRTISKTNVTSLFGNSEKSRITDPQHPERIFEWLLEFSFDDKGNCIYYEYEPENDLGIFRTLHNRNRRSAKLLYANTYLKRVLYGIRTPYKNKGETYSKNVADYFFETVLDYGDHENNPPFNKTKTWVFREDAFSDHKAGFEIRTTRLCSRVLLYHHFAELPGGSAVIKSTDFTYADNGMDGFRFLKEIVVKGYIKQANGTYTQKEMPALSFKYQPHEWNTEVKLLDPETLVHAPTGSNTGAYQFVDLFSEGLSGILTEQGDGWYYKSNLGKGNFSRASLISPKPSFKGLGQQLTLTDLEGNGIKQLSQMQVEPKGFFELSATEEWQPFTAFQEMPNTKENSFSRMLDLTGDGLADILLTEPGGFTWFPSKGKKGYGAAQVVNQDFDEESAPAIVFSDGIQSIFLSDMNGDGLADIVRIKNSEVCYWPNLGYGRFGAKVGMDNAPVLDSPEQFNPAYIKLADIDGSGTSDIFYFGNNKCSIYLNRQGNSFAGEKIIVQAPETNNTTDIDITDLLGTGLSCIVWNSQLSKDAGQPSKYIDIMNSRKPHVMISYSNNMGKEVSLEYTPSTQFYLDDKKAGDPWITKLHFPVHCVSKMKTKDVVTGAEFVTLYKYHHGYYDHHEKEFRGFGMVEQIDTEKFEHWEKSGASNIIDKQLHQDPVLTRSWFHTGAFVDRERILNQFKEDYWYNRMAREGFAVANHELPLPEARLIADPRIDAAIIRQLSGDEWREALRACKSMELRSEVFALDAPAIGATPAQIQKELTPFTVSTHNCVIELLQPKGNNEYAVFVVKESEAISYSYERDTSDPRISHTLNIKFDLYSNVLESASVVYPRRLVDGSLPQETKDAQAKTAILYTKNEFTNDVIEDDAYRLRLPSEVKTYELKGVPKAAGAFAIDDFKDVFDMSVPARSEEVEYHEMNKAATPGVIQRRLIEHTRSIYLANDLKTPLALHKLESNALSYESYQLAFTPALLNNIYSTKVNDQLMENAKYIHSEGDSNWWIRSGTAQILTGTETEADGRNRFCLPLSFTDPGGGKTTVSYYSNYFLFVWLTEDELGNKETVELLNFRTLSPQRMKDMNNNLSEVISDELGMVKAMAIRGKGNEADELTGLSENRTAADDALITSFFSSQKKFKYDPVDTDAKDLLLNATTRFVYDLHAYKDHGKPVVVATILREEHFRKKPDSRLQLSFEYSNGLGESLMNKVQAEPGLAWKSAGNATRTEIDTTPFLRWIGNGRTVLNNKGNVVKQYEPYFSTTHLFESQAELVETGVTPVTYYDPLDRVMRIEFPNGTFTRIEFDSWKESVYDENDNVKDPKCTWYHNRVARLINAELATAGKDPVKEEQAALKAEKHDKTPTIQHMDTQGRAVLSIEHNKNIITGADEFHYTSITLDIEGNLLTCTDARNNKAAADQYDMLGNMAAQQNMDAGKRWTLLNILGDFCCSWDERHHQFHYSYDKLNRPTTIRVTGGDGANPLDNIISNIIYGESQPLPENKNLRGQVFRNYDTGGLLETPAYDFAGEPQSVKRTLFKNYKSVVNWIDANLVNDLETEDYVIVTEKDALGRITREVTPDGSIFIPGYNEAGLLTVEKIEHADPVLTTVYIKDIDYNEKRQRNRIVYGNDVTTIYKYDKETFGLIGKTTTRSNNSVLQDLQYTYDAAGNITHIQDNAVATVFYNNMRVEPASEFTYDALYRLVEATGRENSAALIYDKHDNWNDAAFKHDLNPGNAMATRSYTQKYEYDKTGNILKMSHKTSDSTANWWTRDYEYEALNNRLINTKVGQGLNSFTYLYTHHREHGNIKSLPHIDDLTWNFKEELVATARQRRLDGGTPETTYYQYDGKGERIRKITENQAEPLVAPSKKDERIYIAGYQVYKKHSGNDSGLRRISLSLADEEQRIVTIETRNNIDDGTEKHLVRYQLHNHLGSACLELDGTTAARVISYEEYHPYGTTAYQARNKTIRSAAKQYRFTGMERDEETGLNYHGARYFISWLGRWLSCDPIGLDGGINAYQYSEDSPVNLVDPEGTAPKKYEKQRGKDTAAKAKEMEANLKEAKKKGYTPDPMQDRAKKMAKKNGKTPIEQHHHKGVKQAAEVKLDPKKMGDPMSSVWSTKRDPTVKAGVGDKPVWDKKFKGKKKTPHNIAKELDMAEQAKVPKTAKGLEDAAAASKQRLPATADMTERAKMDWKKTVDKGPAVDPKTGQVVQKEAKLAAKEAKLAKAGTEALEKGGMKVLKKLGAKALKVIPFVGIGAGLYSMEAEAAQGNTGTAVLEGVGLIPVVGDVVDAGRFGVALGEATMELSGGEEVAAEHGTAVEGAAKSLGLSEDTSRIIGATGAALSAITVAPTIGIKRKVASWFQ